MSIFSLPANENDCTTFDETEVGPYVVRTIQKSNREGGGFATTLYDTREARDPASGEPRPARCLWPRDARKNHNAAVATARRLEFLQSAKVGSVLLSLWGEHRQYVDFFVVVDAGPKSIKIQPCGKSEVPCPPYNATRHVVPNAADILGKAIAKRSARHEEGELVAWNGEPIYERMSA